MDTGLSTDVVEGELSHKDDMDNKEALGRGSVQYLSAGKGIVHSVGTFQRCMFPNPCSDVIRLLHLWHRGAGWRALLILVGLCTRRR